MTLSHETLEISASPEQKEAFKLKLSQFMEEKIREAVERYVVEKASGGDKDIVVFLLEGWSDNDGAPAIRRPIFNIDGFTVRFESEATEYDSTNKRFSFGLGKLREAETEDEIRAILEEVVDSVYHEVEHVDTEGAELADETTEAMVKYLCHPGEMEAYGRQFARRYAYTFPGKDFTVERMEELASASKARTGGARNLYHYMTVFAKPDKVIEYAGFGDVAAARQAVIEATKKHLALLMLK